MELLIWKLLTRALEQHVYRVIAMGMCYVQHVLFQLIHLALMTTALRLFLNNTTAEFHFALTKM